MHFFLNSIKCLISSEHFQLSYAVNYDVYFFGEGEGDFMFMYVSMHKFDLSIPILPSKRAMKLPI